MASQGVNVLRWSALATGVVYGFYHQHALNSQSAIAHAQREAEQEYKRKEQLIEQARAEWRKKTQPAGQAGDGLITDPEDKRFDLEKFLLAKTAEN